MFKNGDLIRVKPGQELAFPRFGFVDRFYLAPGTMFIYDVGKGSYSQLYHLDGTPCKYRYRESRFEKVDPKELTALERALYGIEEHE